MKPPAPLGNTLQAARHESAPITEADLRDFEALLPSSARELLRELGLQGGLQVLNGLPGLIVTIPKGQGSPTWQHLTDRLGDDALVQRLAELRGGCVLDVPTCASLRAERRNRAIRAEFDRLTAKHPAGQGLSRTQAARQLAAWFAPISRRQLDAVLDSVTPKPAPLPQGQFDF